LAYLEISGQTDASALHDLSPLQGMSSLTTLWCSYSQVTDLSPLAGRKLTKFSCGHTQVSSLAPLQGMPLTQLACYSTPISSLAPLKGMPLERLTCYSTKITDLSPLVGMPLRELDCSGCGVSDLTPLRGIPLSILNIKRTEVADLGPLFEMKSLGTLEVQGSRVTAEQVASLQKALPNCKIEWSGANQGAGGVNLPIAGTPASAQSIGGLTAPARWQTLEFRPAGRSYVEVTGWKYEGKTPLTAEAWVRPRAIENRLSIIGDQEGAGFALLLAPAGWSNAMVFGAEKKAFNSRAVASIPVDQWSHLAMVYDESKISHYVNGKRQGAQVVVSMQYAPSTTPLLIGANPLPKGVAEEFFDGAIDEVRISSVARYTADFTPQQRFEPDDKTEVLYHFDEGAGTVAKDSSPHGRDGKIVGATWVTASSSSPQPSPVKGKGAGTPPPAVAPFDAAKAKAHQAAWAKYLGTPIETTNSIGMNMVLIPPGEFLMGSTDEQVETAQKMLEEDQVNRTYSYFTAIHHELPQHRVVLTRPFFMGCTEVTVGQFRKFVEAAKYITEAEKYGFGNSNATSPIENAKAEQGKNWRNPGYTISEDTPVGQITWNDAVAFCEWLTQQESGLRESLDAIGGLTAAARYRLPTEAEWEFACRAGTTTHYSFGDDRTQLEKYGWFKKNAGGKAQPVALKLPNSFGLFDMHGNSIEWCQDWHDSAWYAKSPVPNPTGPPFGSRHVIRGGDWVTQASIARSAIRSSNSATMRSASFGFRVVREIDALNSATAETKTPTK
jgi:formylglycine-generating enzyme required for sulfatase activity